MREEAVEANLDCLETENVLQERRHLQLGRCRSHRHPELSFAFTDALTFFSQCLGSEIRDYFSIPIRLAVKVMLIKSSTKDSLFQEALRRTKKVRRFLSHCEILKILGILVRWHHHFLQILQTGQLSKESIQRKLPKQSLILNFSPRLCVNASPPTERSHQLLCLEEAFQVLKQGTG